MINVIDITSRLRSTERRDRAIVAAMRLALAALDDSTLVPRRKVELARGFLAPHVTPDETGET